MGCAVFISLRGLWLGPLLAGRFAALACTHGTLTDGVVPIVIEVLSGYLVLQYADVRAGSTRSHHPSLTRMALTLAPTHGRASEPAGERGRAAPSTRGMVLAVAFAFAARWGPLVFSAIKGDRIFGAD